MGLPASTLANPWKIGLHGDRDQVIQKFAEYARSSAAVRLGARGLGGRRLWCHCRPEERCHGDVLAEIYEEEKCGTAANAAGPAAPFPQEQVFEAEAVAAMAKAGRGAPLATVRKGVCMHIVDGAGL